MAKQPSRRVGRALKKYVKGQNGDWTPAKVKLEKGGGVAIKVNPESKFAQCVKDVKTRGGAYSPSGVCAAAGRKKFGKRKFAAMAKAGKKRVSTRRNPVRTWDVHVPATRNDGGYDLKIRAESSFGALAEARRYCAKRQGVPLAQFHLPKGAKARVSA